LLLRPGSPPDLTRPLSGATKLYTGDDGNE
jgi:hypothetical protein